LTNADIGPIKDIACSDAFAHFPRECSAMTSSRSSHHSLAETLRRRVLEGPSETDPALRQQMAVRASGGSPIEALYADLARQIGQAADRKTDAQVASVLAAAGSEKAAFSLIVAAETGAGLPRWQQAQSYEGDQ
jgi:hypothetical protein